MLLEASAQLEKQQLEHPPKGRPTDRHFQFLWLISFSELCFMFAPEVLKLKAFVH